MRMQQQEFPTTSLPCTKRCRDAASVPAFKPSDAIAYLLVHHEVTNCNRQALESMLYEVYLYAIRDTSVLWLPNHRSRKLLPAIATSQSLYFIHKLRKLSHISQTVAARPPTHVTSTSSICQMSDVRRRVPSNTNLPLGHTLLSYMIKIDNRSAWPA